MAERPRCFGVSVDGSSPQMGVAYCFATACRLNQYGNRERIPALGGILDSLRGRHAAEYPTADVRPRNRLVPAIAVWAVQGDGIVIACEGTSTARQWYGNIAAFKLTSYPGIPGLVHDFFGSVAVKFHDAVKPVIDQFPNTPILLVGHSLGGAVVLGAAHLVERDYPGRLTGVISYGAPRTGNSGFVEAGTFPHLRFSNLGDPVPELPPRAMSFFLGSLTGSHIFKVINGYNHHGYPVYLGTDGAWTSGTSAGATFTAAGLSILEVFGSRTLPGGAHEIDEYCWRLKFLNRRLLNSPASAAVTICDYLNDEMDKV